MPVTRLQFTAIDFAIKALHFQPRTHPIQSLDLRNYQKRWLDHLIVATVEFCWKGWYYRRCSFFFGWVKQIFHNEHLEASTKVALCVLLLAHMPIACGVLLLSTTKICALHCCFFFCPNWRQKDVAELINGVNRL